MKTCLKIFAPWFVAAAVYGAQEPVSVSVVQIPPDVAPQNPPQVSAQAAPQNVPQAAGVDTAAVARVKGDRVNLRGRPSANGEVVGQAANGEELRIRRLAGDWLGVVPPERVRCWILKDFVEKDKVTVPELTVRAGAGISYPRIGSMHKGDAVTARETFGEWICVPPPGDAVVYVNKSFVAMPGEPMPEVPAVATSSTGAVAATISGRSVVVIPALPPPAPVVTQPPTPMGEQATETPTKIIGSTPRVAPQVLPSTNVVIVEAHVITAPPPVAMPDSSAKISITLTNPAPVPEAAPTNEPAKVQAETAAAVVTPAVTVAPNALSPTTYIPDDVKLATSVAGQGSEGRFEGIVKTSPYLLAPGKYRLAVKSGSRIDTVCFLRGNSAQLSSLMNESLVIQGRQFWVQGIREPLVVVERIERRPAPAATP